MKCAANGHDSVATSRDESHVAEVAAKIRREYQVEVLGLPADLSEPGAPEALKGELDRRGIEIETLINTAGRGAQGVHIPGGMNKP